MKVEIGTNAHIISPKPTSVHMEEHKWIC